MSCRNVTNGAKQLIPPTLDLPYDVPKSWEEMQEWLRQVKRNFEGVIQNLTDIAIANNSVFFDSQGTITNDEQGRIRDPDYQSIGGGGFLARRVSQTGDFSYTAVLGDYIVASSLSGTPDITLPAASSGIGVIQVINIDAITNVVVNRAGSDTIYTQPGSQTSHTVAAQDHNLFISDGDALWSVLVG